MLCDPNGVGLLNSFALVSYIPEPLAGFLDALRPELVPNCFLRAHVTVLPPRPIEAPPEKVWKQIRNATFRLKPIEVELGDIEIFPVSDVIYVAIRDGHDELKRLHDRLNLDKAFYAEPYPFHPHVTLAQGLVSDQVDELGHVARSRWATYKGSRRFRIETVTFVQNTRHDGWRDLAETVLGRGVENPSDLVPA